MTLPEYKKICSRCYKTKSKVEVIYTGNHNYLCHPCYKFRKEKTDDEFLEYKKGGANENFY